ncbi:hypothetical protein OAH87_05730 [Marinomonas sp.]|nr:hypothetical protein [Marinomonas sp.]MDB4837953.1 hypothetical protein [Marinomonas sp.]
MADTKVIWFPAKETGLGWAKPTVWQGWFVQMSYLFSLGLISYLVDPKVELLAWGIWASLSTLVLIIVYCLKGEKPNWKLKPIDKDKRKFR